MISHHVETLRRLKYRPTGGFAQFASPTATRPSPGRCSTTSAVPKAGYEALRDACRPVIVVADRLPGVRRGRRRPRARRPRRERPARCRSSGGHRPTRRLALGRRRARVALRRRRSPPTPCQRVGTLQVEVPDAPGPLRPHAAADRARRRGDQHLRGAHRPDLTAASTRSRTYRPPSWPTATERTSRRSWPTCSPT